MAAPLGGQETPPPPPALQTTHAPGDELGLVPESCLEVLPSLARARRVPGGGQSRRRVLVALVLLAVPGVGPRLVLAAPSRGAVPRGPQPRRRPPRPASGSRAPTPGRRGAVAVGFQPPEPAPASAGSTRSSAHSALKFSRSSFPERFAGGEDGAQSG